MIRQTKELIVERAGEGRNGPGALRPSADSRLDEQRHKRT